MLVCLLVNLTRKGVLFHFGDKEQALMDVLKESLLNSPALWPIDYQCEREVILAVDSSNISAGYVLMQVGTDGKRYPNHFGSINWNERERTTSRQRSSCMV